MLHIGEARTPGVVNWGMPCCNCKILLCWTESIHTLNYAWSCTLTCQTSVLQHRLLQESFRWILRSRESFTKIGTWPNYIILGVLCLSLQAHCTTIAAMVVFVSTYLRNSSFRPEKLSLVLLLQTSLRIVFNLPVFVAYECLVARLEIGLVVSFCGLPDWARFVSVTDFGLWKQLWCILGAQMPLSDRSLLRCIQVGYWLRFVDIKVSVLVVNALRWFI